jgi:hypothetical protein
VTAPVATHIWLNGRLLPSDVAHLSAYDRGFQLGDGVFEALRARRGVPIELEGHIARLHRGLSSMGLRSPTVTRRSLPGSPSCSRPRAGTESSRPATPRFASR